nr:hypothetical protein CFP56_28497 [Quercus suber]
MVSISTSIVVQPDPNERFPGRRGGLGRTLTPVHEALAHLSSKAELRDSPTRGIASPQWRNIKRLPSNPSVRFMFLRWKVVLRSRSGH